MIPEINRPPKPYPHPLQKMTPAERRRGQKVARAAEIVQTTAEARGESYRTVGHYACKIMPDVAIDDVRTPARIARAWMRNVWATKDNQ